MQDRLIAHGRAVAQQMLISSSRLLATIERNATLLALGWAALLSLVCLSQLAAGKVIAPSALLLYAVLTLSPAIGIMLATRTFPPATLLARPEIALARLGRWCPIDPLSAHRHPSFGAHGLMTGLAVGLLLNIVLRTGEFFLAVPAIAADGPLWARTMFLAFAIDCILFNLLYSATFIMAIRHVPWFPRVLLLVWMTDLCAQLMIAQWLGQFGLPGDVSPALTALLAGNVQKTLISMALWLPYLLLSERVNVTYRRRIRMAA